MTKEEFSRLGKDMFLAGFSPQAIHVVLASMHIAMDNADKLSVSKKYGIRVVKALRFLRPGRRTMCER